MTPAKSTPPNLRKQISSFSLLSREQHFQHHPIHRNFKKVFNVQDINSLMQHQNSRFLAMHNNQLLVERNANVKNRSNLALCNWDEMKPLIHNPSIEGTPLLIGILDENPPKPYFIVSVSESEQWELENSTSKKSFKRLRSLLPFMSHQEITLAAQGKMLLQWALQNRFCGKCATEMDTIQESDQSLHRKCPKCSNSVYPRVDPVVITLVVDEKQNRCLLGRKSIFPKKMFTALAGFVEPGESIERAVQREVFEETAIHCDMDRIEMVGSQAWPMSNRTAELMIGSLAFISDAKEQTIKTDDELEEAKWFSVEEVKLALEQNKRGFAQNVGKDSAVDFTIPPSLAMAWNLMKTWVNIVENKSQGEEGSSQRSLL